MHYLQPQLISLVTPRNSRAFLGKFWDESPMTPFYRLWLFLWLLGPFRHSLCWIRLIPQWSKKYGEGWRGFKMGVGGRKCTSSTWSPWGLIVIQAFPLPLSGQRRRQDWLECWLKFRNLYPLDLLEQFHPTFLELRKIILHLRTRRSFVPSTWSKNRGPE